MKLSVLFTWILVAVLTLVGWLGVFNSNQIQKVDLSLETTTDIYEVNMVDGETYTLENGVELEFVSMGDLKVGSPWHVLVEVNGQTVSLEEEQYQFQDSAYEIHFDGNKLDLFKLYPG